jgi:hypothetical protein
MADRTYTLVLECPTAAAFGAAIDGLTQKLTALDAAAEKVAPKLKQLGVGASRGINNTGKATQDLTGNMNRLDASAKAAASSVMSVGANARTTSANLKLANGHASALGTTFMGYSAGALAVHAVRTAVRGLADALKDARDYARETAEQNSKLRDSVRELRAIKGDKATTAGTTAGVVDLMLKTGAKPDQAVAFETMWDSAIEAAKQNENWGLNGQQTQDAKAKALHFAVANGIDAATMGRMIPSIGISQKVDSPDELMGQLSAMQAMAVQGVGTFTPIMKVFNKLRPSMVRPGGGGAAKTSGELLGLISAQTVTAGTERQVAQDMHQVWRDLSSADNPDKAATFRNLGIKPGTDDYVSAVEKLAPLLEAGRAAGASDEDTLRNAGFRRTGSNPKLVAAVGNRKVLRARFNAVGPAADPARIDASIAAFDAENPERRAEAQLAAADFARGEESREADALRTSARAGLRNRRVSKTVAFGVMNAMHAPFQFFGQDDLETQVADSIIRTSLTERVQGLARRFPNFDAHQTRGTELGRVVHGLSPSERAAVFGDVRAFGGGADGDLDRQTLDVLKKMNATLEEAFPRAKNLVGPLGADAGNPGPRRQ